MEPASQRNGAFMYTCSKQFEGFPCCHRQANHPGQCHFVHGYSRSFTCWFGAKRLDKYGFVVDFSSFKELRLILENQFDHTFLVNHDDPLLANWQQLHELGALDLRIMQNVGMEASAHWVWQKTNEILQQRGDGRNWCWKVEARENSKNAACWELLPPWALQ